MTLVKESRVLSLYSVRVLHNGRLFIMVIKTWWTLVKERNYGSVSAVWGFSTMDHQESVWGRKMTERNRLEKDIGLSLIGFNMEVSFTILYYVRIIDSKISWNIYDWLF